MHEELTARQQQILALIVRQYVEGAQPVGSKGLADNAALGVSSATVRNEMARLEAMGYLAQPHTSAGRVPTEEGYRYFVQQLMDTAQLPVAERRTIRHQFHQVRPDLEQWMQLSVAILAQAGRSAALITAPKSAASRFKHLELISINESRVLLVLVLQGGTVRQQMLVLSQTADQDWLSSASNRLNDLLHGQEAREIRAMLDTMDHFDQQVTTLVASTMERHDSRQLGQIYRAGIEQILEQPEFSDADGLRQILHILEEHSLITQVLDDVLSASGVQVLIGGEGRWRELSEVGLVLSRYGDVAQGAGVLGLIGPIRMAYPRAISSVQYVSELLTDLLHEFYLE